MDTIPIHDLTARLRRLPDDTLAALAFFSRLPVPRPKAGSNLGKAAGGWPIAGALLALAAALAFLFARAAGFPPMIAAIMAVALLTALTGALHEDGLADTFDGFGGGRTPEAKLAIMRDSRLGAYGALALIFTIVVRLAGLAAVGTSSASGALAIVCVAVLSRALALWHWQATPPARTDGLAQMAGRPDMPAFTIGLGVGVLAALALLATFGVAALIGTLMAAAAIALFSAMVKAQIGGHTGDTIGAAQQLAEAALFAGLAIAAPSLAG